MHARKGIGRWRIVPTVRLSRMLSPDEVEYEARGRLRRRPPSLLLSLFPSVALALPSAPLDVQTLEVVHNAWRLTMTASRT